MDNVVGVGVDTDVSKDVALGWVRLSPAPLGRLLTLLVGFKVTLVELGWVKVSPELPGWVRLTPLVLMILLRPEAPMPPMPIPGLTLTVGLGTAWGLLSIVTVG